MPGAPAPGALRSPYEVARAPAAWFRGSREIAKRDNPGFSWALENQAGRARRKQHRQADNETGRDHPRVG